MWMKSKYASWEAEGQAYERVDRALAEGEQWRLANVARGERRRHLRRRILATLGAGLAWLAARAKVERALAQGALEATPDVSSPLHR